MVTRKQFVIPSGVRRKVFGSKGPNKGHFKVGRKTRGRPKGKPNKLPMTLKEAVLEAMKLLGDKDGLVGFWVKVFKADITLAVRLAEKIIPLQITGPGGGPVQVFSIPAEKLSGLSTQQLEVLDQILAIIGGTTSAAQPMKLLGDGDAYAKEIGAEYKVVEGTRVEG